MISFLISLFLTPYKDFSLIDFFPNAQYYPMMHLRHSEHLENVLCHQLQTDFEIKTAFIYLIHQQQNPATFSSLFIRVVQTEGISAQQVSSTQRALLAIMCVTPSSCLAFTQHKLDVSARTAQAHDVHQRRGKETYGTVSGL